MAFAPFGALLRWWRLADDVGCIVSRALGGRVHRA